MKTAKEILNDKAREHKRKYASFCALIENESSVDVFDIVIMSMKEYVDQIESLYKDEIEIKDFQIVQERKIIAMLAKQVDKLKEVIKLQDQHIGSFGFDKCSCEKCEEYYPVIMQLKKEAGL